MAAKSSRYQLRSSQRLNDESQDYETPRMEPYGGNVDNAQLSQSDMVGYNSQIENFLSESFGSKFNHMNSFNENDIGSNMNRMAKEEADPSLSRYNYYGSQEQKDNQQFIPLEENDEWPQDQLQHQLEDEIPGGYVFSQGLNQEEPYKFVVTVMSQSKSSNKDYLHQQELLFVKFMAGIPFNFMLVKPKTADSPTCESFPMPPEMKIRISLRFCTPVSDDKKRVSRCHVHVDRDQSGSHKSFPFKLNHNQAVYDDANLWVTIPACFVTSLTFYCYSSCAGGIDRKPVYLFFELLHEDGSVAQHAHMLIKVCANPSRDAPKEEEKRKKEEDKLGRGRVKSEAGSEVNEKRGKKRKTEDDEMGRDIKRMESTSPMNSIHTPSPGGWNTAMSAPRVTTYRRESKLEIRTTSSDGVGAMESNGFSHNSNNEDDDDQVFTIQIQGRDKFEDVKKYVKLLETNERYSSRKLEDNPFENLTQLTGDISISTWLSQFRLNEYDYVNAFAHMGVSTLDDVQRVYNPMLFLSIGIPQPAAAKLNKVYLNWMNCNM